MKHRYAFLLIILLLPPSGTLGAAELYDIMLRNEMITDGTAVFVRRLHRME